jgi:dienelactone hydrolase
MFHRWAQEYTPEYSFARDSTQDFAAWKAEALPKVRATLGDFPPLVAPNPHLLAEWEHDGLKKQRWQIDVGLYISVVFQINYPAGWQGENLPALLCCHGHGPFGKEAVMGNDSSPELRDHVERLNYNYGHQMAKAGFITFAIDWMGMGERREDLKPNSNNMLIRAGTRDWCDMNYLHATMLGMTPISINVQHGKAATNFAITLPGVDANRLGVMGLSGGGVMTLWLALCDERFKAAEIICYSDLWKYFGFRDSGYCGMQVAPGLFKLVELSDLQGLLAPRPLLIDIGAYDTCFTVDGALECQHRLEKIYEAAGASAKLELDLFPGEHAWGGNKSVAFFTQYLCDI